MEYNKLVLINNAIWSGNLSEQELEEIYEIACKAYTNNCIATPTYLPGMLTFELPREYKSQFNDSLIRNKALPENVISGWVQRYD